MTESHKPSVLLIYTGGTIGMKPDPQTGVLAPFDFSTLYDEFPYLEKLGVELKIITLQPIDSSNVTPELWIELARLIRDNYAHHDGFVVLHGTDTMSYTASALSFMLGPLAKGVIFTGSQIPIGVLRTDGRENLITSIEIAAAMRRGTSAVPEVCIYFQNKLFRANRTTKHSAEEFNAFRSDNYPPLAEVGVNIRYNTPYIHTGSDPEQPLQIVEKLETRIAVIKLFPGMSVETFSAMLNIPGLRGIVLETYGAGNAPTAEWFIRAVSNAVQSGLTVLNVSQCPGGSVSMELYETGKELQRTGVISGHDITTESAVTKLMVVLGHETNPERIRQLLESALCGEISE